MKTSHAYRHIFLVSALAFAAQAANAQALTPSSVEHGRRLPASSLGAGTRVEPRTLPAADVDASRALHAYARGAAASATAPSDASAPPSPLVLPSTAPPFPSDTILGPALFDGGNTAVPPDPGIACGPDHLVTVVNRNVSMWDKATGARFVNVTLSSFFGAPAAPSLGNPRVVWDPWARRFVASASDFVDKLWLAVSASSDPTAGWYSTSITVPPGLAYPDYPLLGVDAEGIYVSPRMVGSGHGDGAIYAIEKAPLLGASPHLGTVTLFGPFQDEIAIPPCQTFGSAPGQYFVSNVWSTNTVMLRRIQGPLTAPTLLTEGALTATVMPFAPFWVPAQGSTTQLELGNTEIAYAVYHRGKIWAVMTCSVGASGSGVRWFEIDPTTRAVVSTGTISSAQRNYFEPGIAVNPRGDLVLVFNGASATEFPSLWISAHLATDAAGAFSAPSMLKAGESAYNVLDGLGRNRWGNHNTVVFDPNDAHVFWSFGSYARSSNRWGTWITKHELGAPGELVCGGDGHDLAVTTPCPCGNFGARFHGCGNSVDAAGAFLETTGTLALDDVTLFASGMPVGAATLFFAGNQFETGGAPFGDGVRCAGGALVRMRLVANQAGAAEFPEAGDPPLSTATGLAVGSGTYAWYQVAYRNTAAAFCPPSTLNATNGVRILW